MDRKANLRKLSDWEDADEFYLVPELRKLRHVVMYAHTRIDATLTFILARRVLGELAATALHFKSSNAYRRFTKIVGDFDYVYKLQKVDLKTTLDDVKRGKKLEKLLFLINDYRKWFSHPVRYYSEIQKLNDDKEYDKVLENLVNAIDDLNKLFEEYKV